MTRLVFMSKKDDFSRVPEVLLKGFGKPQLAMLLPLDYK
ncbi:protein YcgL [Candidatus Erwinia dacicola]|uniref:Protein YcgL n=1 Tax=Candidatus Erwinia dacicola TaxID=252393 RepID=A0A328TKG2_9GAMM|nr:protein YcgL [Candidatus Erwinia dacicola]